MINKRTTAVIISHLNIPPACFYGKRESLLPKQMKYGKMLAVLLLRYLRAVPSWKAWPTASPSTRYL